MPAVTYDDQSLMIDGRRVWLVSGTIEYSRVPRGHWLRAIRLAKAAGFNCIAARVPWVLHERKQGAFQFSDELDLRHFVELIGQEGMYCILRPGPYVDGDFESGGLPAWLSAVPEMKLREASRPFLDACARWFRAVMAQVQDLQVTSERNGGAKAPGAVLLMQIEHAWFCHNTDQAHRYLGELIRFLREEGCQVPLIEANNCWQSVEGAFSTWMGSSDLAAHMRQFRVVQQSPPSQHFPMMVSEFRSSSAGANEDSYQLAQAIAAGAQFNLEPLCAGRGHPALAPAAIDCDARPGASLTAMKRLATFANQFGHLLAHLDGDAPQVVPALQGDHGLAVLHRRGSQGDVVFLLRGPRDGSTEATLLMPDGDTLTVPLGEDRVAWAALNVNLGGVATLTRTSLRPWAFVDRKLLVLFGPAGADGVVSIDGSEIGVSVPRSASAPPLVQRVDALTLVVLNEEQLDASWVLGEGVLLGAAGVDEHRQPLPARGFKQPVLIKTDGTMEKVGSKAANPVRSTAKLGPWSVARLDALITGASESFKPVAPGSGLGGLDPAAGYGWYRLTFRNGKPSSNLLAPGWAGGAHVFVAGKNAGAVNDGQLLSVKASRDWVVLAGSHGRPAAGWRLGAPCGLAGQLYQVKPVKLSKPAIEHGRSPDPTKWRAFLPDVSYQHHTPALAWHWTLKPAGRLGFIVRIDGLPHRALIMVGEQIVGGYDPDSGATTAWLEVGREITAGRNTIRLALFHHDGAAAKLDPRRYVSIFDATANLTAKADWAFAPWTTPTDEQFDAKAAPPRGQPCWFRSAFTAVAASPSLMLELSGMSRGQVQLNGRVVGTYGDGEAGTAGSMSLLLPAPWFAPGGPNVLTIFDEQGRSPRSVRLKSIS